MSYFNHLIITSRAILMDEAAVAQICAIIPWAIAARA
jgi:hypothetical protein